MTTPIGEISEKFKQAALSEETPKIKECARFVNGVFLGRNSLETIQSAVDSFFRNASLEAQSTFFGSCYVRVDQLPLDLMRLHVPTNNIEFDKTLRSNQISEIISRFTTLTALEITVNSETAFSQTFPYLFTQITYLSIQLFNNRPLTAFPEQLESMTMLQALSLDIPTKEIFSHIPGCTNLTKLTLSSYGLDVTAQEIDSLHTLTRISSLALCYYPFNTIADGIQNWTHLRSLHLMPTSEPQAKDIYKLTRLSHLEVLTFSGGNGYTLHRDFCTVIATCYTSLTRLNLEHAFFYDKDYLMERMPHLQIVQFPVPKE
jgi:hypothetical protein